MKLGLVGAQGVGKTTLAEAVSNETDLPLVFTNTTEVFKNIGLRPDKCLPFEVRIEIQNRILDSAIELWEDHYSFITDRTPLDMLAYTMIDINSDTRLLPDQIKAFEDYQRRCIDATNQYFNSVILVQPGIKAENVDKPRASLDLVLCETMNTLMAGLMMHENLYATSIMIPRQVLDLKDRVRSVQHTIIRTAKNELEGMDLSVMH